MKISARVRTLETPQTNSRTGKIQKDIEGTPVYTQYLVLTTDQHYQMVRHMKEYIDRIVDAITEFGVDEFAVLSGVDYNTRKQINSEPRAYSWADRLQMVIDRLNDKSGKDFTVGIVDAYNQVVGAVYRQNDSTPQYIEHVRIEIIHPDTAKLKNILNPDLFEI